MRGADSAGQPAAKQKNAATPRHGRGRAGYSLVRLGADLLGAGPAPMGVRSDLSNLGTPALSTLRGRSPDRSPFVPGTFAPPVSRLGMAASLGAGNWGGVSPRARYSECSVGELDQPSS